jgi:hypothetical protein
VMIRHFKGASAIGFWSHFMFGLERDQQNDDPAMRSVTTFRCLKDRYTGNAPASVIYYGYDKASAVSLLATLRPSAATASTNRRATLTSNTVVVITRHGDTDLISLHKEGKFAGMMVTDHDMRQMVQLLRAEYDWGKPH